MRHRFHALCPYFAMFPESFVETWLERLTKRDDVILDPFCGRGTTPFQALLMGRRAVACDVNPVAYCVTKAKTNAPSIRSVRRRLTILERGFSHRKWEPARRKLPKFFHVAYSANTLRQLLYLRQELNWARKPADCMIAGILLGSLHGESKKSESYLSNQMPRTISTKPAYSVRYWERHEMTAPSRDVFDLVRRKASFRYESEPPTTRGLIFKTDMRDLPRLAGYFPCPVRCVVTSPPYLDVTNFEEDQWLRLWFLGSVPRPTYRVVSKDDRHERADRYWDLISDMWRTLGQVMANKADVVVRIGGKNIDAEQMGARLVATSVFAQGRVELVHFETSTIKRRQTDSFRPGSKGCLVESDFHFRFTRRN